MSTCLTGRGEQTGAVEGVLPVTGLSGRLPDLFRSPQESEDPGRGPVSSEGGRDLPGGEAGLSPYPHVPMEAALRRLLSDGRQGLKSREGRGPWSQETAGGAHRWRPGLTLSVLSFPGCTLTRLW